MSTVSFSQLAASKCAPLSGAEKASPLCLVEKIENNGSEKGLEACGFRCGIFLYIYIYIPFLPWQSEKKTDVHALHSQRILTCFDKELTVLSQLISS